MIIPRFVFESKEPFSMEILSRRRMERKKKFEKCFSNFLKRMLATKIDAWKTRVSF